MSIQILRIAALFYAVVALSADYTLLNVSRRIPEGQVATGIVLAVISVSAGILNAACMTY